MLMQELSRTFDHYCMQVQGQYYAKPYCIFFSECWNITKNKLIQNFENWGLVYHVEFTLEVTKVPNETWTNVFHFTSKSDKVYYGDRIPALWINKGGHFSISSAVNGNLDYWTKINFEIKRQYQIIIKQFLESGKYWYEIITDGHSNLKIENTEPQNFSDVKLYASDPWHEPFSSDFGNICNVNIQPLNDTIGQNKAYDANSLDDPFLGDVNFWFKIAMVSISFAVILIIGIIAYCLKRLVHFQKKSYFT